MQGGDGTSTFSGAERSLRWQRRSSETIGGWICDQHTTIGWNSLLICLYYHRTSSCFPNTIQACCWSVPQRNFWSSPPVWIHYLFPSLFGFLVIIANENQVSNFSKSTLINVLSEALWEALYLMCTIFTVKNWRFSFSLSPSGGFAPTEAIWKEKKLENDGSGLSLASQPPLS